MKKSKFKRFLKLVTSSQNSLVFRRKRSISDPQKKRQKTSCSIKEGSISDGEETLVADTPDKEVNAISPSDNKSTVCNVQTVKSHAQDLDQEEVPLAKIIIRFLSIGVEFRL